MFGQAKAIKAYVAVDDNLEGASFEHRWFESVIMMLNRIKDGYYDAVNTHKYLIEINQGLQWVQENLNERLTSQHRTLLKSMYSMNIQIINGAIETKNTEYLPVVISSLQTIMRPYERRQQQSQALKETTN
jgi:hypothetical protein